jgi:peroxiredoxin Q/BCP
VNLLEWLGLTASKAPLAIGEPVPDVIAPDEEGNPVRLARLCREGLTLVYFYPKASTPGCTAQACSLRDAFAVLQERGVRIIGVSADSPSAQKRFKEMQRLPFTLLADEKRDVIRGFGVPLIAGLSRRQAFLIKDGRIVWRDLTASTSQQAADVLKVLDRGARR